MIAKLEDFLLQMTPELGGCPVPLIEQKLIRAARIFAERSDSLRETLRIPAQTGQLRYELEASGNLEILKLAVVKIGEAILPDEMWYFGAETCDAPEIHFQSEARPYLVSGQEIISEAILAPKTDVTAAPAAWLDRWNEAIIGWAMQELLSMSRVAWENSSRAAIYAGRYQTGVARARAAARTLRGHERARGIGV